MISNPAERLAGKKICENPWNLWDSNFPQPEQVKKICGTLYLIPKRCTDKFISNIRIILLRNPALKPINNSHINAVMIISLTSSDCRNVPLVHTSGVIQTRVSNMILTHYFNQNFAKLTHVNVII